MTNLVIAEHDAAEQVLLDGNASIKAATLNTIAAAQKNGRDIYVPLAGHDAQAPANATAKIADG